MKYRPIKNRPLTALALLNRQEISFAEYGLLSWLKTREEAVEIKEISKVGGWRPITARYALDNLESAGLIEPVAEDTPA